MEYNDLWKYDPSIQQWENLHPNTPPNGSILVILFDFPQKNFFLTMKQL